MGVIRTACLVVLLVASGARADVYVLGSSYSWDGLPPELDDSPQWHAACAKPLLWIHNNPNFPCVTSSTLWPTAFAQSSFDAISFQPVPAPHPSITLESDVDTISIWMSMQPTALVVIHPTWPVQADWESVFHDPLTDQTVTNRSAGYHWRLVAELMLDHPGRVVLSDRVNEMLDHIRHDIEGGVGPLTDFEQLFRDASGHLSADYGSYLAHNAIRQAFGQPTGVDATVPGVDPAARAYLDGVVAAYPAPEPGFLPALAAGVLAVGWLGERRRARSGHQSSQGSCQAAASLR